METDSQRILSWGRMGYVLFVLSRSNAHQFLKFLQRFHLAQIIAAITGWSKMSWCFLEFFRKAPKYSSSGTGGEVPFLSLLDCNVGSWSKRPSPSANGSEMPLSNRILLLLTYQSRQKSGPQVLWILFLLLLTTSAWPRLQKSLNLGPTLIGNPWDALNLSKYVQYVLGGQVILSRSWSRIQILMELHQIAHSCRGTRAVWKSQCLQLKSNII